jgi:uncharacterized protein (TIGR02646 family)
MRYVDRDRVRIPDDWQEKVATAIADVTSNAKSVSQCSDVWTCLKNNLSQVTNGKCWYCESRQERSDNDVDHFRPKSLYPWLAFDQRNFRFACTFCNRKRKNENLVEGVGGKGNEFPLVVGTSRATNREELDEELPLLIDPCSPRDVGLLDFREDGHPCPSDPEHELRKLKAETSIRLYNLNHGRLIDRRIALASKIRGWITNADKLYKQCDMGNAAIDNAFDSLVDSVYNAISERAEDSIFARKIVEEYQSRQWVKQVLSRA